MKRVITMMACALALTAVASGKTPHECTLAEINSKWMDKTITLKNVKDAPTVMQLLRAFHAVWPTQAGEALIAEAGDRLFVTNDVCSSPCA